MNEFTEVEAAWLAGIIEGEGCLTLKDSSDPRNPTHGPWIVCSINVGMTDEDIVRRIQSITGVGNVRPQKVHKNRKQEWRWYISERKSVLYILERLAPYFGIRRGEKARAQIAALKSLTLDLPIDEIREQYALGIMDRAGLAAKHGVSPATITNIIHKRKNDGYKRIRVALTGATLGLAVFLGSCSTRASPDSACASFSTIILDPGYQTRLTDAEKRQVLAYDDKLTALCP